MPPSIKITKDEINALPMRAYEGTVQLVDTDAKVGPAVEALLEEDILGFDTESKPSFKRGENHPAALLQLGGASQVYLFQLLKLENLGPIWGLLANPEVSKVGVAIADDIKKLQERQPFHPAGFIEIADVTQQAGILNTGLRSLAGLLLGFRISKRAQVSNWAKADLSPAQVQYAATDAWVSRQLFLHMQQLGRRSVPAS